MFLKNKLSMKVSFWCVALAVIFCIMEVDEDVDVEIKLLLMSFVNWLSISG